MGKGPKRRLEFGKCGGNLGHVIDLTIALKKIVGPTIDLTIALTIFLEKLFP